MWHVSSRSGVETLRTAIHLLLTYLQVCLLLLLLLLSRSLGGEQRLASMRDVNDDVITGVTLSSDVIGRLARRKLRLAEKAEVTRQSHRLACTAQYVRLCSPYREPRVCRKL